VTTKKELNLEVSVIDVELVDITTSLRDSFTYKIDSVISKNLTQRLSSLRQKIRSSK